MKLKAYFRGIGAGMIVAALVMSFSSPGKAKIPDEPKQTLLESVEEKSNVSENIVEKNDDVGVISFVSANQPSDADISQNMPEDIQKDVSVSEPVTESEVSANDLPGEEDTVVSEITPSPINPLPEYEAGYVTNGETTEIMVIRGDSSVSVSRRLFEAGLVESAVEFDSYLCQNGYDKYICVGTYNIENGADFETIAKTLTHR